jgi:hypothetical protein
LFDSVVWVKFSVDEPSNDTVLWSELHNSLSQTQIFHLILLSTSLSHLSVLNSAHPWTAISLPVALSKY